MFRTALFTGSAIVALVAGSLGAALHAASQSPDGFFQRSKLQKTRILYNQNSNDAGIAIVSMNFSSGGTEYNSQAADDFVIPKAKRWTITEVDVSGVYSDGPGPAASENVIFYKNTKGLPNKAIANGTFNNLQGIDDHGNFAIVLPNGGLSLKAGHYWVSVIANIENIFTDGEWNWGVNSLKHREQAAWQNPGGGYGVPACWRWNSLENCFGISGDLMFQLKGTSR